MSCSCFFFALPRCSRRFFWVATRSRSSRLLCSASVRRCRRSVLARDSSPFRPSSSSSCFRTCEVEPQFHPTQSFPAVIVPRSALL